MCGVAGVLRSTGTPPTRGEIAAMTGALAHRGPDGEGLRLFGSPAWLALGQRRLAVIDREGGAQPMPSADRSAWVVCNGEIYNHRELFAELAGMGLEARTRSDTEAVLLAWQAWGRGCLPRLRGMFAFALVDFRRGELLLARDGLGIKPLYYRPLAGGVAFASELDALGTLQEPAPRASLRAVEHYLRYQYIPAPMTIFEGVHSLEPGCSLSATFAGCGPDGAGGIRDFRLEEPHRWHDPGFEPDPALEDDAAALKAVSEAVCGAVSAQMVSDVPLGLLLSGGVDSTLVAWAARRSVEGPLPAFAVGFEQASASELEYARQAAKILGPELHETIVAEDMLALLPGLAASQGQPFGDSSILPTWLLCRSARQGVTVALSGDGGDEAFGGYHTYANWLASGERPGCGPTPWEKHVLTTPRPFREPLWRPEFRGFLDEPCHAYAEAARRSCGFDALAHAQCMDMRTYLPGDILTKVDMASMAHALEVRPPLLDPQVLDVARRLPLAQRFREGLGGKAVLKRLLLAEGFSPEFVLRPKQGFAIPREHWFLPGREASAMLRGLLGEPSSRLEELFSRRCIEDYLARHTPEYDLSGILWLLTVFGLWNVVHPGLEYA
ncbi:asparagine synthase (glutamine-hydrolyzing) [Fundidesulfovibrio agrisoli]|uniref:asparagine synthase (glutamine-hydrolyzing) n=1 Tax=Fundidesulfovibrio agrisoli TaxID=2922717 RepID=UPI001FAC96EC|nr:asparagine synthase (glutamine-hydrolyzing) [Fundidesulfovibrio agrisoli]